MSAPPPTHSIAHLLSGDVDVGTVVRARGWIRTRRDSKAGISFLALHDGSAFDPIQVVASRDLDEYEPVVRKLSSGCAVRVEGALVASAGKGQRFEIQARRVELVGGVEDPEAYPIQPKRHSLEYLREVAHLRPRTNLIGAVARVRHTLSYAIHRFLHERGFLWVHTPIITTNDAEGAGELFRVSTLDLSRVPIDDGGGVDFSEDFFGKEAFLTVSGQLNLEAYCCALDRVYTFGPTFRAENSHTRRHLAEFWMVEPEIAFADLHDNVELAGSFLRAIFGALLEERAEDMAFFARFVDADCVRRLEHFVRSDLEIMEYGEAIERLRASGRRFEFPVAWGTDLASEHERYLAEEVVNRPLAIVNYPAAIKAFYMRLNEDEKTVAAMDILAPGIGEIVGGSQREERLDVLDRRITEVGLHPQDYGWYRDLRRYGSVPHAGFGLGLERAMQFATGVDNIRDVIPFPRAPKQADF